MDLKVISMASLRNQLQTTLKILHDNHDEFHCTQLLNYLQKCFEHQIVVSLAFESHNRILFCMILRENITCKNSMIKLRVLNILHQLLTLYETYTAAAPASNRVHEGILLSSQSDNEDIIRKIPSILIEDGLLVVLSKQMNDSDPDVFCSILEFLKRIARLQCNSSISSPYYKRAISVLESALRLGILNANNETCRNKITEFCLVFVQTLRRIPLKQQLQIVTFFSKLQSGRKFPDKLLASKLITYCVNPNIRAKLEKLVSVWIKECLEKHKNYLTVNAIRILLFLIKPIINTMMDETSSNASQSSVNTQYSQYSQSLDESQSIFSSQVSSQDSTMPSGIEQCFNVFLQSPFRSRVKLLLEFPGDEDKELMQVLKYILLSKFPTSDKAGRYLELIHMLQLQDISIGEFIVSNGDFISFLENQLTYTALSLRATQAFKILRKILQCEKEQSLSIIPTNLTGRRIKMQLSTLFAWLQKSFLDFSHLEVVSLVLGYDLTSNFICVQEMEEDSETLSEILLSFQFHVINLLSTVPINLQDIIWGTLCELLCFAQRRVDQSLHDSDELLQKMLLQRFFEDALFVVMGHSVNQSKTPDSSSFTKNNLLCIQRWAFMAGIQATNCQRFRCRIKRNFDRVPELICSLRAAFQQELNESKINESETKLRLEVMSCLRDLRNIVF